MADIVILSGGGSLFADPATLEDLKRIERFERAFDQYLTALQEDK